MKKLKNLGILLMLLIGMALTSCEDLTDTTGSVSVYNNTGYTIIVDVSDGDGDWVSEKTIYSGGSAYYSSVESGTVYCVARFYGESYWYTSSSKYLSAGESVKFTWSLTKKSGDINIDVMSGSGSDTK